MLCTSYGESKTVCHKATLFLVVSKILIFESYGIPINSYANPGDIWIARFFLLLRVTLFSIQLNRKQRVFAFKWFSILAIEWLPRADGHLNGFFNQSDVSKQSLRYQTLPPYIEQASRRTINGLFHGMNRNLSSSIHFYLD